MRVDGVQLINLIKQRWKLVSNLEKLESRKKVYENKIAFVPDGQSTSRYQSLLNETVAEIDKEAKTVDYYKEQDELIATGKLLEEKFEKLNIKRAYRKLKADFISKVEDLLK